MGKNKGLRLTEGFTCAIINKKLAMALIQRVQIKDQVLSEHYFRAGIDIFTHCKVTSRASREENDKNPAIHIE